MLLNAGDLDTSFGGTGQVITTLGPWGGPQGLALQPDLKTVVVAIKTSGPLQTVVGFRYNVDGSLDATFGSGGEVVMATNATTSSFLFHNASVAIQPDGKIVVATNTATTNGSSLTSCDMLVLRFNPEGSLDTTFGQNGQSDIHLSQGMAVATGVAVLPSGQIVVAGTNPIDYSGPEFIAARLTSAGALDTTFGPNGQGYNYTLVSTSGSVADRVLSLGLDASGNILVGGTWTTPSGSSIGQLVRYTPTGLIDTSFANQGVLNLPYTMTPASLGFQTNGQIIVGSGSAGGVTRLNSNGTIDTSFGSNGSYTDPINQAGALAMAVQPDDKILMASNSWGPNGTNGTQVERLLPGGTIDPSFGTGGRVAILCAADNSEGIMVGPDGKITGTFVINTVNPSAEGIETFRLLGDPPVTGQLVVTQQPPASLAAGTAFGLTVDAEDSSGNIETSFNGTVTVALANNPGNATLGGTLTVTASQGVANFSGLTITTAASGYTLLVSSSGLSETVTTAITVTPLAASQVGITQQPPSSVIAGSGFGLQAAIEDQYGNVITGATNSVTVALANNPGGATLGGTLTVTASQGVANFSGLTLTKAATGYTLAVSSSGLSGSTSSAITVTPASATQLVITQQPPASVVVNSAFGLKVAVEDTYGNVVTSASNTVKVAFANNPTGAKLGGTLSVKANQGVASLSGLTINKVGTGYTLQLSSSGMTNAVTNPINVTKTATPTVLSATTGDGALDPSLEALVLDSQGFVDGLGLKKRLRLV